MPGTVVDTGHIAVNKRDTDRVCQMIKCYTEKQNAEKGKIHIKTSQLLLHTGDVVICLFLKQMRNFLFLRTHFTSSDSQIQ